MWFENETRPISGWVLILTKIQVAIQQQTAMIDSNTGYYSLSEYTIWQLTLAGECLYYLKII
jgi:hypothetical protein